MGNITNSLKQASDRGKIAEEKAIKIGEEADLLFKKCTDLFKELKRQVGMDLGERIDDLVSTITKVKSRDQVYHFDKEPEGQ
ncbi:hypothetical protein ACVWYN_002712 [Pedobacter sp. UYP24]